MAGESLFYATAKVLLNNELPALIDIGLEEKIIQKSLIFSKSRQLPTHTRDAPSRHDSQAHKPVAVTPHTTLNVKLEFAGKLGINKPACRLAMAIGAVGQVAVVDAQVTLVHCSPGAAGSDSCELLAADGPWLATTIT